MSDRWRQYVKPPVKTTRPSVCPSCDEVCNGLVCDCEAGCPQHEPSEEDPRD